MLNIQDPDPSESTRCQHPKKSHENHHPTNSCTRFEPEDPGIIRPNEPKTNEYSSKCTKEQWTLRTCQSKGTSHLSQSLLRASEGRSLRTYPGLHNHLNKWSTIANCGGLSLIFSVLLWIRNVWWAQFCPWKREGCRGILIFAEISRIGSWLLFWDFLSSCTPRR